MTTPTPAAGQGEGPRPAPARPVTALPGEACPACGRRVDAHTDLTGVEAPRPDDLSLCISCGAVLRFGPRLELIRLTADELAGLDPSDRAELDRARSALTRVWRELGRPT